jgi:hypothetical protein
MTKKTMKTKSVTAKKRRIAEKSRATMNLAITRG